MNISNRGLYFIKNYEKLRLKSYQDSADVWTIGYGHTGMVCYGDEITEQEAEDLLRDDLLITETYINSKELKLSQNQYDAVVSLVFNIGIGAFGSSTMIKLIKRDPDDLYISSEFVRWIKAGGVARLGLLRRRIDECKLYFT